MNDERPIEKLLRRAAKKRSDECGLPPELHPANRRALQDEVARQFPKPAAPKQSALAEWWLLIKQRWAYGVAGVAVIWVAAVAIVPMLSKPKPQTEIALNSPRAERLGMEMAKDSATLSEPLAAPTAPIVTTGVAADSALAFNTPERENLRTASAPPAARLVAGNPDTSKLKPAARRDGQVATVALPAPATNAATPDRRQTTEAFSRAIPASVAQTRSLAASPADLALKSEANQPALGKEQNAFSSLNIVAASGPTSAPAEATADGYYLGSKNLIARGGGLEREQLTRNSQQFSNTATDPRKRDARYYSAPATPVLTNFRVEQMGRDVRVVDGDGSIYRGVVDEENTIYKQMVERQNLNLSNSYEKKFQFQTPKLADAQSAPKQPATAFYLYRVEGTNRSLNQNVVFTWNFVATNALVAGNLDYKAAAQKLDATKLPSQFPAQLQNSIINGRAQFGEGREVEVNAVPVKP
ncbi:MAG: hypothetical protein AAB370_00280 [Verrucomicrobiota bacterium]